MLRGCRRAADDALMRMGLAVMAFYTLAIVLIMLMMTGAIASAAFKQAAACEDDQMLRNRWALGACMRRACCRRPGWTKPHVASPLAGPSSSTR
jgi:hypothetical protein